MSTDDRPDGTHRGTAGARARREHQRRRANRETRVREKYPRIGGMLLALGKDPRHETAWARGAHGEEHVAKVLANCLNDDVIVLHDRRIPGRRSNIDHIAVAPSGVWVIDAKRYKGKVAIHNPWLGTPKLTIAGRDKTRLVDALANQVATVEAVMAELAPRRARARRPVLRRRGPARAHKAELQRLPAAVPEAARQAPQRRRSGHTRARSRGRCCARCALPLGVGELDVRARGRPDPVCARSGLIVGTRRQPVAARPPASRTYAPRASPNARAIPQQGLRLRS